MLINTNLDIELTKEESENLIEVLNSPSLELERKRNQFFAQGDFIQIAPAKNGMFTAEIDDLDLSVLFFCYRNVFC